MKKPTNSDYTSYNVVIFDLFDVLFTYKGNPSLFTKGLFHIYAYYGGSQNIFQPIESGIELVHRCHNEGKRLFVLSNVTHQELLLLQEYFPHIFKLFEGIVYPGLCGFKKPDSAMYRYLVEKYDIDPATAFFIDDKESNLTPAKNLGITSIAFPSQEIERTLFPPVT